MMHQPVLLCLLLLPMTLTVAEPVPEYKGNLPGSGNNDATDQSNMDKHNIRKREEVQQEEMMEPKYPFMERKRTPEKLAVEADVSEQNDTTKLNNARQKSTQIDGCGATIRDVPEGIIDYPGNGRNYKNNQKCWWEISVEEGDRMEVNFQRFATHTRKDKLLIINGESGTIGTYYGRNSMPPPFTTSGNKLHLYFNSDAKGTEKGFKLTWKTINVTVNQCVGEGGDNSIVWLKVHSAETAIITNINEGNNNITDVMEIKIDILEVKLQSTREYQENAMHNLTDANSRMELELNNLDDANSKMELELKRLKYNQEITMNNLTDANSKLDYIINHLDIMEIKIDNLEVKFQSTREYQENSMHNLTDAHSRMELELNNLADANSKMELELKRLKYNQEITMNNLTDANSKLDYIINNQDSYCPGSFFRLGSECFLVVSNKLSWEDARTNCQLMGSDLAQPSDIAALRSYLEEKGIANWYWIGGSDIEKEGTWKWVDGTEITEGWAGGNPNNAYADENCLIFTSDQVPYSLHDHRCPFSYKSICEF